MGISSVTQHVASGFFQAEPQPAPTTDKPGGIFGKLAERIRAVLDQLAETVAPPRPSLDQIRTDYQVKDDQMTEYRPNFGPFPINIPFVGGRTMTETEANLLDELGSRRGLLGLRTFSQITSNNPEDPGLAFRTADQYVPQIDGRGNFVPGGEDGHNDAFRHAYWNALMVDRFGADFAESFGTAHEGVPGNPSNKEAMDLYNNEVGRQIAIDNPGASDEELADLVFDALNDGDLVVIDAGNQLAWSDQVAIGQTGRSDYGTDAPIDGVLEPPEWNSN